MRGKSDENWRVGQRCLAEGDVNAAASRLYYAVFQAVLWYATCKKGYVRSKSESAHREMAQHVWDTGKGRAQYGRSFTKMMALRVTADYDPESASLVEMKALLADCHATRQHFLGLVEK